ncbi:MAG: hypothetical protein PHR25_06500 [Clostridia bacterium]|nr:hypothetical protein [Clostridia bacterium]MDD4376404.1 hypothetical protein [Clostridia bacterium]
MGKIQNKEQSKLDKEELLLSEVQSALGNLRYEKKLDRDVTSSLEDLKKLNDEIAYIIKNSHFRSEEIKSNNREIEYIEGNSLPSLQDQWKKKGLFAKLKALVNGDKRRIDRDTLEKQSSIKNFKESNQKLEEKEKEDTEKLNINLGKIRYMLEHEHNSEKEVGLKLVLNKYKIEDKDGSQLWSELTEKFNSKIGSVKNGERPDLPIKAYSVKDVHEIVNNMLDMAKVGGAKGIVDAEAKYMPLKKQLTQEMGLEEIDVDAEELFEMLKTTGETDEKLRKLKEMVKTSKSQKEFSETLKSSVNTEIELEEEQKSDSGKVKKVEELGIE